MTPLSEKAKGKQRAVDIHEAAAEAEAMRDLTIRFTEGIPDLVLQVGPQDAVRDVKTKIKTAKPELHNRRLRLIHSGRLLTDGTFIYSWLTSLEEKQRKAVKQNVEFFDEQRATAAIAAATWLHCSVGPEITPEDGQENTEQTTQIKPLRGFDRLASAGFTEEDIVNIRRQFHSQSSGDYLDGDFASEEDFDEHARALEEQWIDSLDNAGTASLSQSSSPASSSALLQGIIVGLFFPLMPFFFFRESQPPVFWDDGTEYETLGSVVFSKRMQMGLVVGFIVNVFFGVWIYLVTGY